MDSILDLQTLPTVALDERGTLPRCPAVYLAIDATGTVLYIGQAENLRRRWMNHTNLLRLRSMQCARIVWVMVEDRYERYGYETALIDHYLPRLNKRKRFDPNDDRPSAIRRNTR